MTKSFKYLHAYPDDFSNTVYIPTQIHLMEYPSVSLGKDAHESKDLHYLPKLLLTGTLVQHTPVGPWGMHHGWMVDAC